MTIDRWLWIVLLLLGGVVAVFDWYDDVNDHMVESEEVHESISKAVESQVQINHSLLENHREQIRLNKKQSNFNAAVRGILKKEQLEDTSEEGEPE